MANDLEGFSKRIKIRAARVEANTNVLVRKCALLVDTAVVMQTPVDTGRARANWQVSIGGEEGPGGVLPAPASPGAGAEEALGKGRSAIMQYQGSGTIHITNNLPYIKRLDEGSSKQAPAGFVEKAIVAGVAAAQGAGAQNLTSWIVENS